MFHSLEPARQCASAVCLSGRGDESGGASRDPSPRIRNSYRGPSAPSPALSFPSQPQPRTLVRSSLFVRKPLAGVQPGLGQGNRSPPPADSPPCQRRTASRIRRCPDCTGAQPGHRRAANGLLISPSLPVPQAAEAGSKGAPGVSHGTKVVWRSECVSLIVMRRAFSSMRG
jgi:hypothetical protein